VNPRAPITPQRCAEWFAVANIGFLGVDIALAHAENAFRREAEWAPLVFSGIATVLLIPMALGRGGPAWRWVERLVGAGAVLVGAVGMVFHLQSAFFEQQGLRNLVYSAPFVAPLAYVGVGLLLLLLRTELRSSDELGWWLLLLALGGCLGNLGLSLLDHAQNAFFRWTEWIPVVAAAFATSFIFVAWLRPPTAPVVVAAALLGTQALVGLAGFALHLWADLHRPAARLTDRFLFGAPAFAPLLFADIAVLAAIGLWARATPSA
jgi:preprotein translocase subunit Sss1